MDVLREVIRWYRTDPRRAVTITLRGGASVTLIGISLIAMLVGMSLLVTNAVNLTVLFPLWLIALIAGWLGFVIASGSVDQPWRVISVVKERARRHIETRLLVSHVLVVTVSLFVFAVLGFITFIIMIILSYDGPTTAYEAAAQIVPTLTTFVLILILVITVVSIGVAFIASRYMSRRLSRQINELAEATSTMAGGNLKARVNVTSADELGDLARRFNLFAERLDELDHQRRSFVANVSHDLRTPIAIMRGHVDQQTREPDDETPTPREAFMAIDREVNTLAALVDDFFTLSRLEEAALPMHLQPVDLGEQIVRAVNGIRPYALKTPRVSVQASLPASLPPVVGDPQRIAQVLNNLIHNAVRHTPEGGLVIVSASHDPREQTVSCTVRDTGVGISPEGLKKVFQRFYQGDSRREGGAGLGLSIVKQLIDAQHGTITVESQEGQGTVFTFTLAAAVPSD